MKRTGPLLMGGLGLAMLGGRGAESPVCAWLNFCGGFGHTHNDALSIGLFAFGTDLLSDIGYSHTAWRAWPTTTHSHNTVVVNGLRSGLDENRKLNRARLFVSDGENFHLAEAESAAAYPAITKRYRRTLLLVGKDSRDAYLLDIFQVQGGEQHDYLLLGPLDEDAKGSVTGAPLQPFSGSLMNPGTAFKLPKGEREDVGPAGGYGFVRNLSSGKADGAVVLDLRLANKPEMGVQTHLLGGPGTTVYLGEAPSIRRTGYLNDAQLDKYYTPFFCARRQGRNLRSVFIATHEIVDGVSKIKAISAEDQDGALFVTVNRGDRGCDYFMMALDAPTARTFQTANGPLTFDGAYGFLRTKGGAPIEAHLVAGKRLGFGSLALEGKPGNEGRILKAAREPSDGSRGWFEVAEKITEAGQSALIVEFTDRTVHSYNVARVEPVPDGSRLYVVEDPGFVMENDGVRLVTFPQREIKGAEVRYRLPGVAH